jgi:fimbrial chaperone protein
MSTLIKPGLIFSFILMMISAPVSASGGIALGATRVIYPADAKQTSLAITNSNKQERYLVNAWIENDRGQKEKTFAVTPPSRIARTRCALSMRDHRCRPTVNPCSS